MCDFLYALFVVKKLIYGILYIVGDTVLVDRNGNEAYGTVEDIEIYTDKTAPYPVEKTKDIIKVIDRIDY